MESGNSQESGHGPIFAQRPPRRRSLPIRPTSFVFSLSYTLTGHGNPHCVSAIVPTPLVILIYSGSCLFGVCYVANITKLPAFSLYLLRWVSIAPTYCAPHGNLMICKIRLQACVLLPVCVERIINFQLWVSTAHLVCHFLPRAFYCTKMCEKSKSTTFSYYEIAAFIWES